MTPNEYQQAALRTESTQNNVLNLVYVDVLRKSGNLSYIQSEATGKRLLQGLMGLNGESGEAIDILKKSLFHGHLLDAEHLAKELGDIAWYLAVTADALGYSLEDILKMNIDKLMARYPEGFDANRSQHRDPNDI